MFAGAPFGLKTLTALFQRFLATVLRNLEAISEHYVDDVVATSKGTVEEHAKTLKEVMQALNKAKLKIRPEKCRFGYKRIRLLGHVVDKDKFRLDPEKVSSLIHAPVPATGNKFKHF